MYLQIPYKELIPWDFVAQIGLGLFFFISGFLLYYNYKNVKLGELKNFYYKRAIRIYPLYWFALFVTFFWMIYAFGFISFPPNQETAMLGFKTILIAFLGFHGLTAIGFNISPFWFVGVILVYYLLYPIITKPKNLINMFSVSLILILIIIIWT